MYDKDVEDSLSSIPSFVTKAGNIMVDARLIALIHDNVLDSLKLSKGNLSVREMNVGMSILVGVSAVYNGLLAKHSSDLVPDEVPDNIEDL